MVQKIIKCKHCNSKNFIKKGSKNDNKIFYCKDCKRTFRYKFEELNGTPYQIHTEESINNKLPKKDNGNKFKRDDNFLNKENLNTLFEKAIKDKNKKYVLFINGEPCRLSKLNIKLIVENNSDFSIILKNGVFKLIPNQQKYKRI